METKKKTWKVSGGGAPHVTLDFRIVGSDSFREVPVEESQELPILQNESLQLALIADVLGGLLFIFGGGPVGDVVDQADTVASAQVPLQPGAGNRSGH